MDEEAAERRVGTVLRNKWRLEKVLGIGGMATVYAATHRNGMRGAVKILHPDVARNADSRARFLREGYLANKVKHGAVKVLDDDTLDDGSVFLVMELLEGQTVEAIAIAQPGERLAPERVRWVARALLEILVGAHEIGLVHRDLKPENLFLTNTGELRVLDFGIARLRDPSGATTKTTTTSSMGTPAFMPPEQAIAEWDRVGPHSDIYAVGASLFSLLTGELTHIASTAAAMLVAVASKPARPIRSVLPNCPSDLAHAIDKACAFDPAHRWPSAKAMLDAIAPSNPEDADVGATAAASRASAPDARFVGAKTEALTYEPTPHPFRAMITQSAVTSDKTARPATKRAVLFGAAFLVSAVAAALVWTLVVRPAGTRDSGTTGEGIRAAAPESRSAEPHTEPRSASVGIEPAPPSASPAGVAVQASPSASTSPSASQTSPSASPPVNRLPTSGPTPRPSAPPKSSGLDLSRPD